MTSFRLLERDWRDRLAGLIDGARGEIFISSPYITKLGADFLTSKLPQAMRREGRTTILTDLSPLPICQGATDPVAIDQIFGAAPVTKLSHLPRLHAKVYIADKVRAIVTSGNLTGGGLVANFEYGVEIMDPAVVARIHDDMTSYAELGALIHKNELEKYGEIADRVRASYRKQMTAVGELARAEFISNLRDAEDELIRIRLSGGAMHSVFARTLIYLLKRHGPLSTKDLHPLIQAIHPDLCDNSVDRVIDGKHFGKKWKHAVRTAQQMLKKLEKSRYSKKSGN